MIIPEALNKKDFSGKEGFETQGQAKGCSVVGYRKIRRTFWSLRTHGRQNRNAPLGLAEMAPTLPVTMISSYEVRTLIAMPSHWGLRDGQQDASKVLFPE